MAKRVHPKSLENLRDRSAPDHPGETEVLTARVRPDQRQALKEIAQGAGVSLGVIIRRMVDEYIDKHPKSPAGGTGGASGHCAGDAQSH
jgi:hypothetical protein